MAKADGFCRIATRSVLWSESYVITERDDGAAGIRMRIVVEERGISRSEEEVGGTNAPHLHETAGQGRGLFAVLYLWPMLPLLPLLVPPG